MPKSLLKEKSFLITLEKTGLANRNLIQRHDLSEVYSREHDEETHAS